MSRKGKNVPCEGCRERKKKCSAGQPCERCKRLSIECIYLKSVAPIDTEYVELVDSRELESNLEQMSQWMTTMEGEMKQLILSSHSKTFDNQYDIFPKLSEITDMVIDTAGLPSISSRSASTCSTDSSLDSPQLTAMRRHHPSLDQCHWKVSIGKNGLSIDTNIQSFDDLLRQLQSFRQPWALIDPFAFVKQPSSPLPSFLNRQALSSTLRRGHFNAIRQCIIVSRQTTAVLTDHIKPTDEFTLRLVETFFSCQFLQSVMFHQQTFYDLFVDRSHPTSSAVVCALCAAVLTMRCHHVRQLVPYNEQTQLSTYYIQRARDLVACHFDEPTLETLSTFVLMALYYSQLMRPDDTQIYLDMALRMKNILDDQFKTTTNSNNSDFSNISDGELETYNRQLLVLLDVARFIEFTNNQRGVGVQSMDKVRRSMPKYGKLLELDILKNRIPKPMPDEPPEVVRAIKAKIFGDRMHQLLCPYLGVVRFQGAGPLPTTLFHKTETAVKEFYLKDLPPDFRLSLSIFEDGLTCDEFRSRLKSDPHCDRASLYLAIRYYNSVLSIHEPLLQRLPARYTLTLSSHQDNEPEADDKPSEITDNYTLCSQEICHRAAVIIVRLLEYQMDTFGACHLLMIALLSAFDIHLRNACLGARDLEKEKIPSLSTRTIQSSREYLMRCVDIIRKGYCYNAAERHLWQHHQTLESKILESLFASQPFVGDFDPNASTTSW